MIRNAGAALLFAFAPAMVWAQLPNAPEPKPPLQAQPGAQAKQNQQTGKTDAATPATKPDAGDSENASADAPVQSTKQKKEKPELRQTKRMLWIAPNFGAVNPGTELPPMTTRQKFHLAFNDSFDYTSFVWTGILAAQSMSLRQYPEFGDGMAAYGRYYWRGFLDGTSGTYFTEAIVPALTHEDPRYFTLGHGGFLRRFGYALSRTALTRTDSGGTSFNWSELGGNGAEAALSNLYYPPEERGVTKTMENWGAQMESAALNNIAKEFWPDFRRDVLRMK